MKADSESQIARDLVARILKGDQRAETEMYERYRKGLLFMLRNRSNSSVAEDVFQETWLTVLNSVRNGKLQKPESLAAFIVQTGRNQLIMYFRRNERYVEMDEGAWGTVVDENETHNPEKQKASEQLKNYVKQAIDCLDNERDRTILQDHYLKEQDTSSTRADLQLSSEHFSRVLYRAKSRLKTLIGDGYDDYH